MELRSEIPGKTEAARLCPEVRTSVKDLELGRTTSCLATSFPAVNLAKTYALLPPQLSCISAPLGLLPTAPSSQEKQGWSSKDASLDPEAGGDVHSQQRCTSWGVM